MLHHIEDLTYESIFFNIITYLIGLILLIYFLKVKKIFYKSSFIFLILSLSPFFLNNFLFTWQLFPDQSKYLFIAQSIRDLEFDNIKNINVTQLLAGIFYSLFPAPFINSYTTLSIISRFFFLITLILIYKEYLKKRILFFLFFCPSIILYTSVALRETFIFSFIILFFFNLEKKRYVYSLICILLLCLLKPEITLMLILALLVSYIFFGINNNLKIIFLLLNFLTILLLNDNILEIINNRYQGFYYEEFNYFPKKYTDLGDLIINLPLKIFYFITSPLFESTNIFRSLQIIENIIIYIYLIFYFKIYYNLNKLKTLYWFFVLFLNLSIYSLVVVNAGSIARYKITLILFIILSINYSTKKNV
jgi:hypothetical protein